MSYPWDILQIEPTSDSKTIKRAYAKKLRALVPDEQPEEFQQLKAAFDFALILAKNANSMNEEIKTEPISQHTQHLDHETMDRMDCQKNSRENEASFENSDQQFSYERISFLVRLHGFMSEKNNLYRIRDWKRLLDDLDDGSIDEFMENSYGVQLFLTDYFPIIPKEIIHLLFEKFELNELTDCVGQENFISPAFLKMRSRMYHVPPFSFEMAAQIANPEEYFRLRYSIYRMIEAEEEDSLLVEKKINRALLLCSKDSDLYNLQILDILRRNHGQVKTKINEDRITSMLTCAEKLPKNQTFLYLKEYLEILKKKNEQTKSKLVIHWHKENLVIPENLYLLLNVSYFLYSGHYETACMLWKRLPIEEKRYLKDDILKRKLTLPKQLKKEFLTVAVPPRNKKIKNKIDIDSTVFFIIVAIIMFILFLSMISQHRSNNYPTIRPQVNSSLTDALKKKSNFMNDQASFETQELTSDTNVYRFVETFYLSDSVEKKQQFKNDYFQASISIAEALNLNETLTKHAQLSDFTIKINKKGTRCLLYYKKEPIALIKRASYSKEIEKIEGVGWEQLTSTTTLPFEELVSNSSVVTVAEKFVYTFYITDNQLLKEAFILTYVPSSDNLTNQMTEFVRNERFRNSGLEDYSFNYREYSPTFDIVTISYKDNPFCAIRYSNERNAITALVGNDWGYSNETAGTLTLFDIEEVTTVFIQKILFSYEKIANKQKYETYFSENAQSVIEAKNGLAIPENLRNAKVYLTTETDEVRNDYSVVEIKVGNETKMWLTVDQEGRLDHIYGENWEDTPTKLRENQAYEGYITDIKDILRMNDSDG